MTSSYKGKFRGHSIYRENGKFYYLDDDNSTIENWKNKGCGFCGKKDTEEGHDGCLGVLPNVINACCGHGETGEAYVQFEDGSELRGKNAIDHFNKIRGESNEV